MFLQKRKQPQDYVQDYVSDQPYLSGLLTGLVAGLAVGFLFAPRSGKELRKQIADTVGDQTKEVKHQWDKTKAQAKETVDHIKNNVGLGEDEFSRYADRATKKAKEVADEADKAIKDTDRLTDEAKSALDKVRDSSKLS